MKAFIPEISISDKTIQRELRKFSEEGPVLLVFNNSINLGNRPSEEKLEKVKNLLEETVKLVANCSELYVCNPSGCFRPQTIELVKRVREHYEVEVRFLKSPKGENVEVSLGI